MLSTDKNMRRSICKSLLVLTGLVVFPGISATLKAHAAPGGEKILIVYFSHTNNTRTVAQQIHSVVGGDMLELKTVQQYPTIHNETVKVAVAENKSGARPELSTVFPDTMGDYDNIFVGYPVWEYTMPMALFTFFDTYKFPGKTIVPFSTHLGSRLGGGPRDIQKLCPEAKILEGLAVRGNKAGQSQQDVTRWLKKLGLADK